MCKSCNRFGTLGIIYIIRWCQISPADFTKPERFNADRNNKIIHFLNFENLQKNKQSAEVWIKNIRKIRFSDAVKSEKSTKKDRNIVVFSLCLYVYIFYILYSCISD